MDSCLYAHFVAHRVFNGGCGVVGILVSARNPPCAMGDQFLNLVADIGLMPRVVNAVGEPMINVVAFHRFAPEYGACIGTHIRLVENRSDFLRF